MSSPDRPTPGAAHLGLAYEHYDAAATPGAAQDMQANAAVAQAAALIAISEQLQHIAQSLRSIDVHGLDVGSR